MIIDRKALKEKMFGLVGFDNPTNPDYPNLVPSLLVSRSGRYVNRVHSLLNDIENLDQSIKNFSMYNYPAYDSVADTNGDYSQGSKVEFSGVNYEYINLTTSSGNPPPNAAYWCEIDELSDYLIKTIEGSIDESIDDWINAKKDHYLIKSIYDKILLFNGTANYRNLIPNQDMLVGLRFTMMKGERSLVNIINKIGHHFDNTFSGLTVYLFHSSQNTALATFTINHTKEKSSQWTTLIEDNILRYISDDHDAGGDFFLCYKQSQLESLGAQAYKMDIGFRGETCNCTGNDDYYKQYSNFVDIVGFSINESFLGAGDTLFDPDRVSISLDNNYGFNLNMSAACDIGYFIAEEERLFDETLQMKTGLKLLEAMASNTRGENGLANQVKIEAEKQIYHSKEVYGTVFDRYWKAVKGIRFDLSGLGEECFPCDDDQDSFYGIGSLR